MSVVMAASAAPADHAAMLPVLLPAATAVLLLAVGDSPARRTATRAIALLSLLLGLVLAVSLLQRVAGGEIVVYRLGDWPAPFGIVLVADRLAALMLLLTSCVALPALWAATEGADGWDTRGRHFHALFQFQLMGLNGAFVTGDLFNLFVFFEVLLIASYVLMLHGLGRVRLKAGMHYVVLNLVASALFLIGVSLLYAVTGTLNLADLALRVPLVPAADAALLRAAALVLLVVFAFKAALMPWALWLPATYSAASAPVAALFAIMTKVGAYAVLRVHGVVFGPDAGLAAGVAQPVVLALALVTCAAGVLGALAANTLARLAAWLTVSSVGTVLVAVGVAGPAAWSAALFYLAHSTLIGAALFLLADAIARQRAAAAGDLVPAVPVAQPVLLGVMFLLAAASAAGLPPLPGFISKVMLLQAAAGHAWAVWVWGVVLVVGFFSLIALGRAGTRVFWHVLPPPLAVATNAGAAGARGTVAAAVLLALGVALTAAAAPLQRFVAQAATQLGDRAAYARAVLPELGGEKATTTRPYRIPQPAPPPAQPGGR